MNTSEPFSAVEQRLHPLSWLFLLQRQLGQLLLPLLALVLFGSRVDRSESIGLLLAGISIAVLLLVSLLNYLTYRYRIDSESVAIRSGWLQRSRRDIPFSRIHNVSVHQALLHRAFGVAEVRLESAGGSKPEAEMRVLRLDQARALEQLLRVRAISTPLPASGDALVDEKTLLRLRSAEILRLGLISNRGMVVVLAALGLAQQLLPRRSLSRMIEHTVEDSGAQAQFYLQQFQPTTASLALVVILGASVLLAILRLLSVGVALVQYHGFRLSQHDQHLTMERGLLTRLRSHLAQRRIQAYTVQESLLQRLFRRRQLRVDSATSAADSGQNHTFKELAPIATPQTCDALLQQLLPHLQWPPPHWQPVLACCWWRLWLPWWLLLPLALIAWMQLGAWAWLLLAGIPFAAFGARQQIRRMAYWYDEHYVAVRGGWWSRWWRLAEIGKLQALHLSRSPLDRLTGTATLWLDSAGAGSNQPPLRLRFIPLAQAQAVYLQLSSQLARHQLEW